MQALIIKHHGVSSSIAHEGYLQQRSSTTLLPFAQWQSNTQTDAVEICTDDDITPLLEVVDQLALIAVHFKDLNDGRGFSIARKLRDAGFNGELRATGAYIRDQLQFLSRCGFNAFVLPEGVSPQQAEASLTEFSVFYQTSSTG